MGLGNLIKREIAITICTVLLVSTTFLMFSYSIFKVDKEAPADTIKFGDIALRMCVDSKCDENINNLDNVIGIETTTDSNGSIITRHIPIFPINDPTTAEEWASLKPYTFELTNTGSLDLYVTILLEKDETSLTLTEERKTPSGTTSITYNEQVDDSEVKIGFGEVSATPTIKLYSDTLDSSDNKHKISKNILLKAGETKTYNLYAWLRSDAQNASQGKYFITNITTKGEYLPNGPKTLSAKLLEDNPTIGTRTDFTTLFKTNTPNTLYKTTENGTDVYYFSGVDFLEAHCEYNGKIIENYSINSKLTKEQCLSSLTLCKINNILYYGHSNCSGKNGTSITTTEAKWVESVEKPINNWVKFGKNSSNQDLYWRIIRTNSDGSIRVLYHGTSTTATDAYIETSKFNEKDNDSMYAGYMYGTSGSQESNRTNTNNSTIKTAIDKWYANNMTSYTKYLSTTAVYCNDREVGSGTYSATGSTFDYAARTRLKTNKTPTYDCTNDNDKFTVDASTGNGKLTYPIALMTADEIAYAGGVAFKNAPMWYYTNSSFKSSTGTQWWHLLSPNFWNGSDALVFLVAGSSGPGLLGWNGVGHVYGVRPVVSLKSCTLWSQGDGSPSNPYEIKMDGGC